MLDPEEHGIIAVGTADELKNSSSDKRVIAFFRRNPAAENGVTENVDDRK
jgi:hypothetical protein